MATKIPRQAATGMKAAAATALYLSGYYLWYADVPRDKLPTLLLLAAVTVIPLVLAIACATGTACALLAAWIVTRMKLPSLMFPLLLALLGTAAALLWMARASFDLGGIRDFTTGLWPLTLWIFVPSLIASLWFSSRALSIPIFDSSRWRQPLDEDAWSRT